LTTDPSTRSCNRISWIYREGDLKSLRLDSRLRDKLPGLSRQTLLKLFAENRIRVNGRPAAKGVRISTGDQIEIDLPGPFDPFPRPDTSFVPPVLFEDQTLLIVAKPGLVPSHPLTPFETGTLANYLIACRPELKGLGNKPLEPGLVHRLDTGTSGLMAIAKTQEAWVRLKKDLANRRWQKTYLALVQGRVCEPATLSFPLAHDRLDPRRMKIIRGPSDPHRGRVYQAVTRIRPKENFPWHTLIEADLITGVTHQLRVHLAALGHPIVGDSLYGSSEGIPSGLPPGRFFLHASRISFPHPLTGKRMVITSKLPEDLGKFLKRLKSNTLIDKNAF
jgi:23S rRNA pseudouridine1911/1915/1917 synthase